MLNAIMGGLNLAARKFNPFAPERALWPQPKREYCCAGKTTRGSWIVTVGFANLFG
jgi:hypothetical protein